MKKNILFCFLILFLSFSCSKSKTDIISYDESETIRNEINIKEKKINWSKEIDPEILEEDITHPQRLSKNLEITLDSVIALKNYTPKVYPYIDNLGSLDISNMETKAFTTAQKFCQNLINKNFSDIEQNFDSNYLFNLVFFKKDYDEKIKQTFTNYYITKEIYSFDLIQIPIRFYNRKNFYMDLNIYIAGNDSSGKINNIEIIKWGNLNGQ